VDVQRKFKGFDLAFKGFYLLAHIILFSWKLAYEEPTRGDNQKKEQLFRHPTGQGCNM